MASGRERVVRTERVWRSKRRRRVKMEWTTLYSIEILRIRASWLQKVEHSRFETNACTAECTRQNQNDPADLYHPYS
eukprot:scaffold2801_cov106-Skeletonema_dohrnii-CCMP3373.AAC.11